MFYVFDGDSVDAVAVNVRCIRQMYIASCSHREGCPWSLEIDVGGELDVSIPFESSSQALVHLQEIATMRGGD
jgi:hypothetical protein